MIRIAILTTGGTIEKRYDETTGHLRNVGSVLQKILEHLRLPDAEVRHVPVMSKDSLDLTDADRQIILSAVRFALQAADAVLIIHGTDTLAVTGELLQRELSDLNKPVIFTGSMRPFEFRDTDAHQNITEALIACRLCPPGVYVVMHNQVLKFPGVVKDRDAMTFRRA